MSSEPHPGHHSNLSPLRLFQGQNPLQQRCSMAEQPHWHPNSSAIAGPTRTLPRSSTDNRRPLQSTFRRKPSRDSFNRPQASRQESSPPGPTVINQLESTAISATQSKSQTVMLRLSSYLPVLRGVSTAPLVLSKAHHSPRVPDQVEGSLMGMKAHSVNEPPAVVPGPQSAQQIKEKQNSGTIATPQIKVDKVPSPPQAQGEHPGTDSNSQATSTQPRNPSVTTGPKSDPKYLYSVQWLIYHHAHCFPAPNDPRWNYHAGFAVQTARCLRRLPEPTLQPLSWPMNHCMERSQLKSRKVLQVYSISISNILASLMESQKVESEQRNVAADKRQYEAERHHSLEMSKAMMKDVKKLIAVEALSQPQNPVSQFKPPPPTDSITGPRNGCDRPVIGWGEPWSGRIRSQRHPQWSMGRFQAREWH